LEIKNVNVNTLKMHPKNPRVHSDSAIDKLLKSINTYGWTNPILVSKDDYVLAGHARLKAAEKAGIEEVPVIYLPLEGAKADAYLIADNKLQDETDWNLPKLKDLLLELDTGAFDIEITGFGSDEIEDMMKQSSPADIDELLKELDVRQAVERPIWATIRTKPENQEVLERVLTLLEQNGIRAERSYDT